MDPTKVSVSFIPSDHSSPLPVLVNGEPENVNENRAKEILEKEEFEVLVDLGGEGEGEAKYWTCDFSYVCVVFSSVSLSQRASVADALHWIVQEYVRINGDYRS